MPLIFLGRGLLVGGVVGLLLAAAPAIVLGLLPPALGDSVFGTVAALLLLTVVPLAVLVASAGGLLLLWGVLRRGRG